MNICIPLSDIKDVVLIVSSMTTVVVAIYGLNKWRLEYKVKVNYELSRSLLKSIYSLRDRLDSLRSNFITANEFMPNYDFKKPNERENYTYIFNNRLKYFNESYSDFLSQLPEVEVIFGKELRNDCVLITVEISSYLDNLNQFIQLVDNTNNVDYLNQIKKIVFRQTKDDKYRDNFEKLIVIVETKLTGFIKI